jgi:hypothetical protein
MAPGTLEYERNLVRRQWTQAERRVVIDRLLSRLLGAVEPFVGFVVFGALTAGLIFFPLPAGAKVDYHESAFVLSPVFGLAAAAFFAYAVALLVFPVRALLRTFSPIYIVDGYIRARRPDRRSDAESNGYVAVLDDERRTIAEWPSLGAVAIRDSLRPALVEFSFRGGIHRIDGRSTRHVLEFTPSIDTGSNVPRR